MAYLESPNEIRATSKPLSQLAGCNDENAKTSNNATIIFSCGIKQPRCWFTSDNNAVLSLTDLFSYISLLRSVNLSISAAFIV